MEASSVDLRMGRESCPGLGAGYGGVEWGSRARWGWGIGPGGMAKLQYNLAVWSGSG